MFFMFMLYPEIWVSVPPVSSLKGVGQHESVQMMLFVRFLCFGFTYQVLDTQIITD